jgi:PEP-CTERM motif-containing protein
VSDPTRPVRVRRTKYLRRARVRRTIFAFAGLLLLYLGGWWAFSVRYLLFSHANRDSADVSWVQGNLSENMAMLAAKSVSVPLALPRRVIYPYSVIPGGVQTPEDLRQVSEHDRVVGGHYAGFDFRNARIVELEQPRLVYLSYRMGDKIFWTGKKISLRKGEKLITDGKITARTRCANQVAEAAQPAVSPAEPNAAAFEMPFDGTAAQVPFPGDLNALMAPRDGAGLGPATPVQTSSNAPFPGGGLPPVFSPPIPSKACPPGESGGPGKPCHHKPPPPPVPEPATMLLVSSGIAGIYWRHRRAAAKRA